jgi:hypothetical protein
MRTDTLRPGPRREGARRRWSNDYAARRLVYPQSTLGSLELQRRFQWRHDSDGLSIVVHNSRRRLT